MRVSQRRPWRDASLLTCTGARHHPLGWLRRAPVRGTGCSGYPSGYAGCTAGVLVVDLCVCSCRSPKPVLAACPPECCSGRHPLHGLCTRHERAQMHPDPGLARPSVCGSLVPYWNRNRTSQPRAEEPNG